MNLRKGTFRLWVVLSVLFVIGVGAVEFSSVRDAFRKAQSDAELSDKYGWALLLPTDCSKARGILGKDYERHEDGLCWYDVPRFRALYPEYKDLKDSDLGDRLYAKAGVPITKPHPWQTVAKVASIAFGIPIFVLLLGASLFWAVAGFRSRPAA
jgi:hypothetical protein